MTNAEVNAWRGKWNKKSSQSPLSLPNSIQSPCAIIDEAIRRAYAPSVQNTDLKRGKYGSAKLQAIRNLCVAPMKSAFDGLYQVRDTITETNFILWEKELAKKIRCIYHQNGASLYTYGNAQKWINMTIKYIFSSGNVCCNSNLFKVCFLPIDRTVMEEAKKLGVKKLSVPWSKCDDWNEIEKYQNDLQAEIQKTTYKYRLWWECNVW